MLSRFVLLFRDWTPVEFELPVEGADKILCSSQINFRKALSSNSQSGYYLGYKFVLQRLLIDGLNNRTGNSHIISGHSVQQGFKPAERCLNVRVKEGEHFGLSGSDPSHPSPHQSLSEWKSK